MNSISNTITNNPHRNSSKLISRVLDRYRKHFVLSTKCYCWWFLPSGEGWQSGSPRWSGWWLSGLVWRRSWVVGTATRQCCVGWRRHVAVEDVRKVTTILVEIAIKLMHHVLLPLSLPPGSPLTPLSPPPLFILPPVLFINIRSRGGHVSRLLWSVSCHHCVTAVSWLQVCALLTMLCVLSLRVSEHYWHCHCTTLLTPAPPATTLAPHWSGDSKLGLWLVRTIAPL